MPRYEYLGNWTEREGNECVAADLLRANLARRGYIRLNTELVKKPKRLLEYVVVHEMVHLVVPDHGDDFVALMNKHYPGWRDAQAELNALPLAAQNW